MAAGATLSTDGGSMCLTIDGKEASITPCTPAKTTQIIDFGRANETVSQIKVRVAVAVFGTRGGPTLFLSLTFDISLSFSHGAIPQSLSRALTHSHTSPPCPVRALFQHRASTQHRGARCIVRFHPLRW